MFIIGFNGPIGSGKTATSNEIVSRSVAGVINAPAYKIALADPLKRLAMRWFGWNGEKDEAGRRLLQKLGTDVGRAYNTDIWVTYWRRMVEQVAQGCPTGLLILCDDVRFDNEAAAIKSLGGVVVRLDNRTTEPAGSNALLHASEGGINPKYFDFILDSGAMTVSQLADAVMAKSNAIANATTIR